MKTTTILTLVLAITFAIPSFAETIQNGANCDSGVLNTTSGSAELNAKWDANTIHLDFDPQNGGSHISGTCTYDGGITLPTQPQRTGYNFVKWQVKGIISSDPTPTPSQGLQCTASMLPGGIIDGEDYGYIRLNGSGSYKANEYGLTENGEWAASLQEIISNYETFEEFYGPVFGIMRGTSFCSAKSGDNHDDEWGGNSADWSATYDELTSAGEGGYCWCHMDSYTPTNGEQCTVPSTSRWVFYTDNRSPSNCASYCAGDCGSYALYVDEWRNALFGQN